MSGALAAPLAVAALAPMAIAGTKAEDALRDARALFASDASQRRDPGPAGGESRDATAILTDLAARAGRLSGSERRAAAALLARPTEGGADPIGDGYRVPARAVESACPVLTARGRSRVVCVHWVRRRGSPDSPPNADANGNRRPDWVETTIQSLRRVWAREVRALGYRLPLRDLGKEEGQGPNRGIDVYIADIGTFGISGYCTRDFSEGGRGKSRRRRSRSHAYCVVDNDYRAEQFPEEGESGVTGLKVTLAHELFHAIQSAYDTGGDAWLREGTATWIEDEVFNRANSNYRLLGAGPLHQLEIPLDASGAPTDGDDTEYAAWIYWRFLSEYLGDPAVVRRVWERIGAGRRLGGSTAAAVTRAIAGRAPTQARCRLVCAPTDFVGSFSEFALWNLDYPYAYEEGESFFEVLGCSLFADGEFRLDATQPSTGARGLALDRLSVRFVQISAAGGQGVQVSVDLPAREGAGALVQPFEPDGARACGVAPRAPATIQLDAAGDGTASVPAPARFELLFINAALDLDAAPYRYQAELIP